MEFDDFDHKQEFAGLLRNITGSLAWNQNILSKHIGVSRQQVGTFCNGTALPAAKLMEKIIVLFQEHCVNEDILREILRHYVSGLFPSTATPLLRRYLWSGTSGREIPPEIVLIEHLHNNTETSAEKFFRHLMSVTGCDCCCVYRNNGHGYPLAEHFHFAQEPIIAEELDAVGREYFHRWLHALQPGTILEIEIDRNFSPLLCRSSKFRSRCFALLSAVQPEAKPKEAIALIYTTRHPAYNEIKREFVGNAMKLWSMHRERERL